MLFEAACYNFKLKYQPLQRLSFSCSIPGKRPGECCLTVFVSGCRIRLTAVDTEHPALVKTGLLYSLMPDADFARKSDNCMYGNLTHEVSPLLG